MYGMTKPLKESSKAPVVKLIKVHTTMLGPEDGISETDSRTNKSSRSRITKISRLTGREDRRKQESELADKIHNILAHLNSKIKSDLDILLDVARSHGLDISPIVAKNIEEMLDAVVFIVTLGSGIHSRDYL